MTGTTPDTPAEPSAAPSVRIAPSADVDERAKLGDGTSVWHLAQVREDAILGRNCVIGRGAYVGTGVRIGDNVKIQNYALVYEPATLGDGSFVGPAAVFTNDHRPRSVAPDGTQKRAGDWHAVGVELAEGASVGARAVCVAPVRVGRWAMVGAGSVVTRDVPDFALVVGVPARRIAWVGKSGERLVQVQDDSVRNNTAHEGNGESRWRDPVTDETYRETAENRLVEETP
jgi:UDP-2-acetamido-3-amino-2,3-dideoxy-glucuronate N-acetyltransferase